MSGVTRRAALQGVTVAVSIGSAGCTDLFYGSSPGVIITTEPVATIQTASETTTVVHFEKLPQSEQSFARIAVESGTYLTCDATDAMYSFAHRAAGDPSYLIYEHSSYALHVSIHDEVYADSAPVPDEVPDC